ncbi:HD family phosphohydrolase [Atrimonas thermophila]|uniref:HD family phosphohydrolase n=1 Tax=Atrimonas thermophila TaxID=3064161 RepID=UPI00399D37FF
MNNLKRKLLQKSSILSFIKHDLPLFAKAIPLSSLIYALVLFAVLWIPGYLASTNLYPGKVLIQDIVAPTDLEIVDVEGTRKLREKMASSISPRYLVDQETVQEIQEEVASFFVELETLRQTPLPELQQERSRFIERWKITSGVLEWLVETPLPIYTAAKTIFLELLNEALSKPIAPENLEDVLWQLNSRLEEDELPEEGKRALSFLAFRFLKPTAILDVETMQRERQEIISQVEPVKRIIPRGEILIPKGSVLTQQDVEMLRSLGLGNWQRSFSGLLTLSVLIIICCTAEFFYLKNFTPSVLANKDLLWIRILIVASVVGLNTFSTRISPYFVLLPIISFVLCALLGREAAFGEVIVLFPLLLWSSHFSFIQGSYSYLNLLLPIFLLPTKISRRDLIRTGFLMAFINVLLVALFAYYEEKQMLILLENTLFGLISGIGSSVLALGAVAFLESTFHVASDFLLLELVNPTHPLLRRLMIEAPGTYNHSIMVANLAEAAAEEIGADPLLARAGAYYHDIGKLKRPYFFIENQMGGRNIHNRLNPNLSALAIQNHVKDGVEVAREYHLPPEIIEIIRRHHGRTLMRYFYEKALRERNDTVMEEEFRYPGPLPRTPEEVLVFLADSVEAAVRGIRNPTPSKIETAVENILQNYLKDGQLDEADLTLKDLRKIVRTFVLVLIGTFHTRLPYLKLQPQVLQVRKRKLRQG